MQSSNPRTKDDRGFRPFKSREFSFKPLLVDVSVAGVYQQLG